MNEQEMLNFDRVLTKIENIDFDINRMKSEREELQAELDKAVKAGYKTPAERRAEETKSDPELVKAKEEKKKKGK